MLNFIQSAYGVRKELLSEVQIANMDLALFNLAIDTVEQKRCYDNSYNILATLQIRYPKYTLGYVLGFAIANGFPIPHAWIVINDKHIDPTLELYGNTDQIQYLKLIEFDIPELIQVINTIGDKTNFYAPPMLETLFNHPTHINLFKRKNSYAV